MIHPITARFHRLRNRFYSPHALVYETRRVNHPRKELTTGGSPFKANVEQHLVAQGFAQNFSVHGDSLSRKIRMIKDAVPPPMANAFGKFARDHMKELVSLTETMQQDCGPRKRKPEAEIVDRGTKRVR
jgi:hypothetical protein